MKSKNIYLWQLIMAIALFSLISTLLLSIFVSYKTNRETLVESSLEAGRAYAEKLANTIDFFVENMKDSFEMTSSEILPYLNSPATLAKKTDDLRMMSKLFNAVYIADTQGEILASSPAISAYTNIHIEPVAYNRVLRDGVAVVSSPFLSDSGVIQVSIMHPLSNSLGKSYGVLGGTISLEEDDFLGTILGNHFNDDGSFVYVVDRQGNVIYHPDPEQLFQSLSDDAAVAQLIKGMSGVEQVVGPDGKEMLAGFAYVPSLKWGIVSQRPLEIALSPLKDTLVQMILFSVPVVIVVFLLALFLSIYIARPLNKMATVADQSVHLRSGEHIEKVNVWYFESTQLKDAIYRSIEQLRRRVERYKQESALDYLTGLYNRRFLTQQLNLFEEDKTAYFVIFADIDRFKRINDTYGHVVGDEVLRYVADHIRQVLGNSSYGYRYGGEEFCIIMPDAVEATAFEIAEKLRVNLQDEVSPCGEKITVSLGIACYPESTNDYYDVINKADAAMYVAKRAGGNRTVIAERLQIHT